MGFTLSTDLPIKEGGFIEVAIPYLCGDAEEIGPFSSKVISISKTDAGTTAVCEFSGVHESVRAKIRSVVIKGTEVTDIEEPAA